MAELTAKELIGANYNEFWKFKGRYRILKGGRGSKKSTNTANWYIWHLLKHPKANLLCVRRVYNTLKDSCFVELKKAVNRLGVQAEFKFTISPLEITVIKTGQKVLFRGFDNPDTLTSINVSEGSLCWVWIEEAYQIESEEEFNKLDYCIRGEDIAKYGLFPQFTLTMNPWSEMWIKDRFFDVKDDNVLALTRNWYHNEFLSKDDKQLFLDMKERNPEQYKVVGEGEWGQPGGQYFSEFLTRIHTIDPFEIPQHWRRYVVFDYGLDMFACYFIAVDERGKIYFYKEIYESGLIVSDAIKRLKEMTTENVYMHIAPPDMWNRRQETGKSIADLFRDEGIILHKADNDRVQGWLNVKEWLKVYKDEQEIETSKLKIFTNCGNLIRCIPLLQFDEKNPNDVATEPHEVTHAPDALRYFIASRPHPNRPSEPKRTYNFAFERPKTSPVKERITPI